MKRKATTQKFLDTVRAVPTMQPTSPTWKGVCKHRRGLPLKLKPQIVQKRGHRLVRIGGYMQLPNGMIIRDDTAKRWGYR